MLTLKDPNPTFIDKNKAYVLFKNRYLNGIDFFFETDFGIKFYMQCFICTSGISLYLDLNTK